MSQEDLENLRRLVAGDTELHARLWAIDRLDVLIAEVLALAEALGYACAPQDIQSEIVRLQQGWLMRKVGVL